MKLTYFLLIGLAGFFFSSCKKADLASTTPSNISSLPTDIPPSDFRFTLESVNYLNNQTTFMWKVVNANPWSCNNPKGTKDLKDWLLVFKEGGRLPIILAAFYGSSKDNMKPLSSLAYSPVPGSCFNGNALKFCFGTKGGDPSYYTVVLYGNYNSGISYAITTSESNKDCSKHTIPGVSTDLK